MRFPRRLVKKGGRFVKRARSYWLLLAEGHLTRGVFGQQASKDRGVTITSGIGEPWVGAEWGTEKARKEQCRSNQLEKPQS